MSQGKSAIVIGEMCYCNNAIGDTIVAGCEQYLSTLMSPYDVYGHKTTSDMEGNALLECFISA